MVPGCCENGRPVTVDQLTGRSSCTCKYPHGAMPLPQIYDGSHPPQHTYLPLKHDAFSFYSPLVAGEYEPNKDGALDSWRAIHHGHPRFYLPYDASLSSYSYRPSFSPIGYDAARRKNATKEATNTLKAWLFEHHKNPYPTKGEKIMLAIITKMTMTQISTWFANARRRLKKENKMTWSPRSRSEDEDSDADVERDDVMTTDEPLCVPDRLQGAASHDHSDVGEIIETTDVNTSQSCSSTSISITPHKTSLVKPPHIDSTSPPDSRSYSPEVPQSSSIHSSEECDDNRDVRKPKIWSISEVLSDRHSTERTSHNTTNNHNNINTSMLQFHCNNASSSPDRMLYTGHTSRVLKGQGFAIMSGNGGATHTWNPLSLSMQSGAYHGNSHPLSFNFSHSLAASHVRASYYSGYQHRLMTAPVLCQSSTL